MKPQDWFGLGVRFAGVWCVIQAVLNVLYFLDVRLGFAPMRGAAFLSDDRSPVGFLMYAAAYAVLGAYFLLGTGHLIALTFGETEEQPEPESQDSEGRPAEDDGSE